MSVFLLTYRPLWAIIKGLNNKIISRFFNIQRSLKMPVGKRQQSSAILYTVVTFVALFVIATTVAVIFYVKFEEQRTIAEKAQKQTDELASPAELRKIGNIVGQKQRQKSWLNTMSDNLDKVAYLIIGGPPEETSADVKVKTAHLHAKETLADLTQDYPDIEPYDPDSTGLVRVIKELKTILDNATNARLAAEQQLNDLQKRFEDTRLANFEKEQTLLVEKVQYKQQVEKIKQDYDSLKAMLEQTTQQQVQTLITQLNEERNRYNELYQKFLQTQAEFTMVQSKLKLNQSRLEKLVPPPDIEVEVFGPDAKIILIDDHARDPKNIIVHINIGSDDHVYQGLTFSVYDRNMPIPRDGKGKAEIEVFDVGQKISAARIIKQNPKRPIVPDDIVANLIWNSNKKNIFVIAGAFDLDRDGSIDNDAFDRIKVLIEKWGGSVDDDVSINTDFLVLGNPPRALRKPTFEQMEINPMATEQYELSLRKRAHYDQVLNKAKILHIPITNYARFLYLIGYREQAKKPGAF